MNIFVVGLNYSPEPIGIGPFTAGVAEAFAEAGHQVEVIAAKPYYPQWRTLPGFVRPFYMRSTEAGVAVTRVPIYVPKLPSGLRRLIHYASFIAASVVPVARVLRRARPDVVLAIAPSLLSVMVARLAARISGAKLWIHVQDFEVDAAAATGLLERPAVLKLAGAVERWLLDADCVSTISPQMRRKLIEKGVPEERTAELRNWADVAVANPGDAVSPQGASLAEELGIATPHVALYSGNMARKQGVEIIAEAARLLAHRGDLTFLVCGNGPARTEFERLAADLPNLVVADLRPRDELPALLSLASVHLLPQTAGAADLVLPSKLANMLASGRPVVATADPGTGLAAEVEGCGVVTPPGDSQAFAQAIAELINDSPRRRRLGEMAAARAERSWAKPAITRLFVEQVQHLRLRH